jgi:hypothetical protein
MDDLILDKQTRSELPMNFSSPESGWKKFFRNKTFWISLGAVVILGIAVFVLVSNNKKANPQSNNVLVIIKGPSQISSGNEAEYDIVYRNGENADLVNVSLEVLYPSGFTFKSATPIPSSSQGQSFNLPLVKAGQGGEVVVRGKLSGSTGSSQQIRANLHYSLSNFNSEFEAAQSFSTSILPPNLTMDVNGPTSAVNGQDMTFDVTFTNVSSQDFGSLGLQLTYPDGFSYTSASQQPQKGNNYWVINNLATNASASIQITGSFMGDIGEIKLVRADMGQIINGNFSPQISSTATFGIIPATLSISLSGNSNSSKQASFARLGDTINYALKYNNQGNIGLSNLIVTVKLDGPALDLPRLQSQNAVVTGDVITWRAATLSNLSVLSPNESGELDFSVPLKTALTSNLQNQTIVASASISSDEITKPIKALDLQTKLLSDLGLSISGSYISGATPMQVGQPTVVAVTFTLSNLSNDVSNTQVVASLPLPPQSWNNVIIPDSEKERLSFDPNSGNIRWDIGDISAFIGKFSPALQVTFQLQVTPNESDRGKVMTLLTNLQASGHDNFVDQDIQSKLIPTVTVSDLQDDVLDSKGAAVQ